METTTSTAAQWDPWSSGALPREEGVCRFHGVGVGERLEPKSPRSLCKSLSEASLATPERTPQQSGQRETACGRRPWAWCPARRKQDNRCLAFFRGPASPCCQLTWRKPFVGNSTTPRSRGFSANCSGLDGGPQEVSLRPGTCKCPLTSEKGLCTRNRGPQEIMLDSGWLLNPVTGVPIGSSSRGKTGRDPSCVCDRPGHGKRSSSR